MPSISVVIPYYNDCKSIEKCIGSVLNQSCLPREIIIIDDFSKDSNALSLIVDGIDFGGVDIQVHRNIENKNGAYSRNRGVDFAGCDYIALLDADDYWLPNHLSECLKALSGEVFEFVYSNVIIQGLNGRKYEKKCGDLERYLNAFDIILDAPPQTGSFFFCRSIIDKVCFDESLRRHQDYQFFYDLIKNDINIKYLDVYTSVYCESPRPLSSRLNFEDIIRFWEDREDMFSKNLLNKKMLEIMLICISVDKTVFLELVYDKQVFGFYRNSVLLKRLIESRFVPYIFKKISIKLFYLKDFSFFKKIKALFYG